MPMLEDETTNLVFAQVKSHASILQKACRFSHVLLQALHARRGQADMLANLKGETTRLAPS